VVDQTLIQSLGFIVVAAALFGLVARPAKVPSIVAYILAGLVLGPITGLLGMTETIEIIAEVGIVLLLFLVGLELSIEKIRHVGRVAVIAGVVQMVLTAGGIFLIARLFGFGIGAALFFGIALMFSSTVVVVKLLEQTGGVRELFGRIAIGILLVQDMAVILVLTLVAGMGRAETMDVGTLLGDVGIALVGMIGMLVLAVLAARYVLPPIFRWIAPFSAGMFIWSLCWCFLFVTVAHILHLSPEIGAFLAGVSIAQLPYNDTLRIRVHPLMNFFIAIFFVSLGLQMELGAVVQYLGVAAAFIVFTMVAKPLLFFGVLARLGYGERTTWRTGSTLAQISEFGFIFAALAVAVGLVDAELLAVIAAVGLVTMAASSYLIVYRDRLTEWVVARGWMRTLGADAEAPPGESDELRDHVIVVGMNSLGRKIVKGLLDREDSVVAIDTDPGKLAGLDCPTILGNVEYREVLHEAGFERAKLVVSALQIEDTNNILAYYCREEGIPSSIHAFDRSVIEELRDIGVSHLMISKNDGIKRIAARLWTEGWLSDETSDDEAPR